MNLYHLRYFVQLAHTRHYTRAAEQLCITQPSLSHAISQLENELGLPLFEKTGRNTELTRFGEQFLECAERTLSTLDEGVEELKRVSRGEGLIRLGLLRTLGVDYVPDVVSRFLAANSGKKIRFTFKTGMTNQLLDGLSERKYDMVFASKPPAELGFTSVAVERQDLVLIVPRDHPLANRHSVDLRETLPYPQAYFSEGSGLRGVVDELFSRRRAAEDRLRDRRGPGHRGLRGPRLRHRGGAVHGHAPAAECKDNPNRQPRVGAELLHGHRRPHIYAPRSEQFPSVCPERNKLVNIYKCQAKFLTI